VSEKFLHNSLDSLHDLRVFLPSLNLYVNSKKQYDNRRYLDRGIINATLELNRSHSYIHSTGEKIIKNPHEVKVQKTVTCFR
jgi:hypothetical protein